MPLIDLIDQKVDSLFSPIRKLRLANQLFYALSAVADHSLLWFLFAAIEALSKRRRRFAIRAILALGFESLLVNLVIKSLFGRQRPIERSHDHPLPLRYPLTSSFPSGHATSAFAAAQLVASDTRLSPILLTLAGLVAASRIHVRIHHASDVIGGAIFGTIYGITIKHLVK